MAESLADLLRTFRSAARLSQEALAERAALSTRTVSDIETGVAKTPRLVTVMLLAEALALSAGDRDRLRDAARRPADRRPSPEAFPALRPARLIGRERALAEVSALVRNPEVRLVTLCGPAGVGKTSLALHAAAACAGDFENGAAFVGLATVRDPGLVPAQIARTLGLRDGAEMEAGNLLLQWLANRQLLLVLDTLEHLTAAAGFIASLLESARGVKVIATSREALRLQAEHVQAIGPLDPVAAAELFVRRAQAVSPEFVLGVANESAVSTIVQRLDGLPLAIELAAPRLRLLAPKALASRLDQRLPLLDDGAVDLPHRQQTMRGAIAWSYDLLSPEESHMFRHLAVLQGGASLEAARAVSGGAAPGRSFLLRVAALVDKSLLRFDEDEEAEPRIVILDMLREYALERLTEAGELNPARKLHAAYFLEFARIAEHELTGAQQALWLARLEREHPNIRAALSWALEQGEIELGLEMAASVWRLWWLRGYLVEGQEWLARFLDLLPSAHDIPARLRAKALRARVVLMSALGNFADAQGPCEEAVRLQREASDESGLCASLTSLGIILQFRGDLQHAKAVHAEALGIRARIGDELGTATSLSNLSSTCFSLGEFDEAEQFAQDCAAIYRRLGHTAGIGHALMKLGLVAAQREQFERAERLFEEALNLQRGLRSDGSVFYSLTNLGSVAQKRGHHQLALERYREALALLHAVPNKTAIAATLEGLAQPTAALGEPRRAARLLGAAHALRDAMGSPLFPSERADYDAALASMREMLGTAAFEAEWQVGTCMTLERALEEARAEILYA